MEIKNHRISPLYHAILGADKEAIPFGTLKEILFEHFLDWIEKLRSLYQANGRNKNL